MPSLCFWLQLQHLTHTHILHTHQIPFYAVLWRGSIPMTVNSPDSRALSIFRQYCSVVKWTNTQRMKLLTGLMMPDWLAAADTSGDEDVIYFFLSFLFSPRLLSLTQAHTRVPWFGSCSRVVSQWSISLCSFKEEFDSNKITQSFVPFAFVHTPLHPSTVSATQSCCLCSNTL